MPKVSDHKVFAIEAHPGTSTGSTYASGDLVGGKMTFANVIQEDVGGAVIISAELRDESTNLSAADLLIFDADISTGTVYSSADNAALTVADADLENLIGVISFSTGSYKQFAANEVAVVNDVNMAIYLNGAHDLYGLLVTRGTPVYTSSDDLAVRITVER